jgi:hypothetical protein
LHRHIAANKVSSVETALKQGVVPCTSTGLNCFHIGELAQSQNKHWAILLLLLQANPNGVHAKGPQGETLLMREVNSIKRFKHLVDLGAELHELTDSGLNVMNYAMAYQNVSEQVIQILSDAKVNPNIPDENGKTPIFYAINTKFPLRNTRFKCTNSFKKKFATLLACGANLNIQDNLGRTPLMYAVENSIHETDINLLINAGANISLVDNEGHSALYHAAVAYIHALEQPDWKHELLECQFYVMFKLFVTSGNSLHELDQFSQIHSDSEVYEWNCLRDFKFIVHNDVFIIDLVTRILGYDCMLNAGEVADFLEGLVQRDYSVVPSNPQAIPRLTHWAIQYGPLDSEKEQGDIKRLLKVLLEQGCDLMVHRLMFVDEPRRIWSSKLNLPEALAVATDIGI